MTPNVFLLMVQTV